MTEPVRLSKRLAALIGCSRSEAEQYIENGWVSVDGSMVEEPQFKVSDNIVSLDPAASLDAVQPATILLHKPEGASAGEGADLAWQKISLDTRSADDNSGVRALKRHFHKFTIPLGLGSDSSGLTVLTQDWRVSRRLIEETLKIEQEYVVEVSGELMPDGLTLLNHGLSLGGGANCALQGQLAERKPPAFRDQGATARSVARDVRPGRADTSGGQAYSHRPYIHGQAARRAVALLAGERAVLSRAR